MTAPHLPAFADRHIGPSPSEVDTMLATVGRASLDALTDAAIPAVIRATGALDIEPSPSELAVLEELRAIASRNRVVTSMIGLGYHGTVTPALSLIHI